MKKFDVHWTSYDQKYHYIIGTLKHDQEWSFLYNQDTIHEAIERGFRPFPEMSNINVKYTCDTLFPVFEVRYLLNRSQPTIFAMQQQTGQLATDKILIKQTPLKGKRYSE